MRRKAGQRVYFDAGARSATKLVRGRTDALWARLNLSAAGCAARKHGECGDRKNCTHVISPFRSSGRKNRNCRGNFAILPLSRPPPGNLLWIPLLFGGCASRFFSPHIAKLPKTSLRL